MLDRYVRPLIDPALGALARVADRLGFSANALTTLGAAFGLAAALAISQRQFAVALALGTINRLLDGVDGPLARRRGGVTDFGGYLDAVCDFLFYAAVPLGFAFADPATNALPAAVLLAAFLGTGSSFLAFGAIAARRGLKQERLLPRSFYYLGGAAEGTETILVFVLMCVQPGWFGILAYAFTLLCVLTVIGRVATAARLLR